MAANDVSTAPQVSAQPEVDVIHEQYNYTGDQICSIKAENTVFKIHRYLLTRDSTVFKDMFDLPPAGSNAKHDDEIIYLQDSAQTFSTLCWALYALPMELMDQLSIAANVGRLIELARIANKYQFGSLEAWSTKALERHCEDNEFLNACTYDDACALLSVAVTCASKSLQNAVESGILKRPDRMQADIPWKQILPIFDEFGTRKFRGLMYYNLLQAVESSGCGLDEETGEPIPLIPLDPEHIDRVRRGHWSTIKFWTCFVQDLPQGDGCTDHQKCRQGWRTSLLRKCRERKDGHPIPQAQILMKLSRAEELVKSSERTIWDRGVDAHDACLKLGLKEIAQAREGLRENMAVFFLGREITT